MQAVTTSIKLLVMFFSAGLVLHATLDIPNVVKSYFFIPHLKASGEIEPLLVVGWTLVFEMFFYLIFTISMVLRANVYVFCGVVMGMLSILSLFRPDSTTVYWFLCNSVVLEFWLGMLVGYLALQGWMLQRGLACFCGLSALGLLLLIPAGPGQTRLFVAGLPAVLLVYAGISLERYIRIPAPILFFGAASYSLYLFHPLAIPAVPMLLNKLQIPAVSLSVCVSIILALAVAAIIYQFIEKPIDRYLKKWSKERLNLYSSVNKFTTI